MRRKLAMIPVVICLCIFILSFLLNISNPGLFRFLGGFGSLIFLINRFGLETCYYNINAITIDFYILGFNSKSIDIADILKISFKKLPSTIYGNSKDAFKLILRNNREIAISPKDKQGFISHLLEKKKNIELDEEYVSL